MTTRGTTIHRNQRRRRFGDGEACFPRGSRAIDCYYTRVNPALPIDTQLARIRRGAAQIEVEAELRAKIARSLHEQTPLKVKLGLDPTAPDLHLGHTVVLQKLRDFQELGHQIIIIIGDFTGMIGDPTGRSETRKPLTWEEIRANAETYKAQLGRVIDMGRTEVRFNSEWLGRLTFEQVIRETSHLTVARMLERQDFAARYASGRAISLHEFLYPLAQGYDSFALGADVELGGTDQTFNLLVGRDLQRAHGQEPQVAVTVPILEGLDGVQKMSKSLGNYVGITEPPIDMYGKLMSVSDDMMFRYFVLVTRVSEEEIRALRQLHPMEAKKKLARVITAMYHGEAGGEAGEAHFARVVQGKQIPEEVEEQRLATPPEGGLTIVKAIVGSGLATSSSEARRLVLQGAVEVGGSLVTDPMKILQPSSEPLLLRVGKRRYKSLIIEAPRV
jgi:tyrosyl-tRNA synthetase